MDLNKRDEHFEKNLKRYQSLKESFKKIYNGTLLNEKKLVTDAGKKLLKNVTKLKEEDTEETKKDDVVDAEPKADEPKADDAAPVDAAPAGEVPPVDAGAPAGDVPPAPVSTDAPEGGAVNSQDQLTTTEFVKEFMKGLPSDVNLETSVDANGIFKASVNDQHEGQFVVVAFPAAKNIHQVADLLEPALPTPAAAGTLAPVDGAVPPVAPVDAAAPAAPAGEVPPAAPAEGSPLDAGAAVPPAGEVPPAPEMAAGEPEKKDEEEPMKEEVKEDMVCENDDCMDESCSTHGKKMMEEEEDEEAKLEKQRDPMMEGRKAWKAYQKLLVEKAQKAKLLKEETATAVSELEKAERRCEAIKKQLEAETDEEEKKALKADLEKAESAVRKLKTAGHAKKALDKVVDSIPKKDSDD